MYSRVTRIVSAILLVAMMFSLLPQQAKADGPVTVSHEQPFKKGKVVETWKLDTDTGASIVWYTPPTAVGEVAIVIAVSVPTGAVIVGAIIIGGIVIYYIVEQTSPGFWDSVAAKVVKGAQQVKDWWFRPDDYKISKTGPVPFVLPVSTPTPRPCKKVEDRVVETSHLTAGGYWNYVRRVNGWRQAEAKFSAPVWRCHKSENDGGLRRGFQIYVGGGWTVYVMIHTLDDRNPSVVYIRPGGKLPAGFERGVGTKECCLECAEFAYAYIQKIREEGHFDEVEPFDHTPPPWVANSDLLP